MEKLLIVAFLVYPTVVVGLIRNQKSPIKSGIKTAVGHGIPLGHCESKKPHQIGD